MRKRNLIVCLAALVVALSFAAAAYAWTNGSHGVVCDQPASEVTCYLDSVAPPGPGYYSTVLSAGHVKVVQTTSTGVKTVVFYADQP